MHFNCTVIVYFFEKVLREKCLAELMFLGTVKQWKNITGLANSYSIKILNCTEWFSLTPFIKKSQTVFRRADGLVNAR